MFPPPPQPPSGPTTTADYLVGAVIGEGSFGRVVHGKHKQTVRDVAIKVVEKVSLKRRPDALQAVLKEQSLLKMYRGLPSVVNLWASFHDSECVYLVMECAKGGNLKDLIVQETKLLSTKQSQDNGSSSTVDTTGTNSTTTSFTAPSEKWLLAATHYGLQILEALEEIHSHQLVHGDLKPENILVTERGRIQLADFGSAIQVGGDGGADSTTSATALQHAFGTSDYACPEILRGLSTAAQERQGYKSSFLYAIDMWSFGCILYAMIVGESPFHSECDALAVQKIFQYAQHSDAAETRAALLFYEQPNFPDHWRSFVAGLLHPDPAHRTGTYNQHLKPPPGQSAERDSLNWYAWIKDDPVWKSTDINNELPDVLPKCPKWLQESAEVGMRDGAGGWSVFLM